jgi:hypothetical protein
MKFLDFCDANRILVAVYPPHSTHALQPLDICLFAPLAAAYNRELTSYINESQGLTAITKWDFFRLFDRAWPTAFTSQNILSGFEKCGLHSFNPERVLQRFRTRNEDRRSSSESSGSALNPEDWRRIQRILRELVDNIHEQKAAKLSYTIHQLSVENSFTQIRG